MREAKGVPEDNVGVINGGGWTGFFDPHGETLGGLAGGLRDVSACGVDLVVGVYIYLLATDGFEGGETYNLSHAQRV